jgi:phage N-6-adenine-methyltransferase
MTNKPVKYRVEPHDQERRTPPWLFAWAARCLGIDRKEFLLDAFASAENALCHRYYSATDNGLVQPWEDATFANPPFEMMGAVIDKALDEQRNRGIRSAVVGPAGCSQRWFHKLLPYATAWCPSTRINYLDREGAPTHRARTDTMLYTFENVSQARDYPRVRVFSEPVF